MKFKDQNVRKVLVDHAFPPDRGLNDYIELFGFAFADALKSLKTLSHWMDAGSGEGRALREFHHVTSKKDVFTTSVSLKLSSKLAVSSHKTIVNYIEELRHEDVRSCDLITDVEGAFQYTEQPDVVLKKYLLWLRPEGNLFLFVKPDSTFVERAGSEISFGTWVKGLPGLQVVEGAQAGSYIIKKNTAGHSLPRMKLIATRLDPDLRRKFREM